MRYRYTKINLDRIFNELKDKSKQDPSTISSVFGVSHRTFSDWRRGATSIPENFLKILSQKYNIYLPKPEKVINESLERLLAAQKGGRVRYGLYGNLGTPSGRRKGGKKSSSNNKWFKRKLVVSPTQSDELAEFIGIILGDGGISQRQVTITLNKTDDREYAFYIRNLAEKLFKTKVAIRDRRDEHVIQVIISRTSVVQYLVAMGLHTGSKVRNQTEIPLWIRNNINFSKACVRGLIDTDGCFYIDKHLRNNKSYQYACLNLTNQCKPILRFFKETMLTLRFHPTQGTARDVVLRRKAEVIKYMEVIGTSNLKISSRFDRFILRPRRGVRVVE